MKERRTGDRDRRVRRVWYLDDRERRKGVFDRRKTKQGQFGVRVVRFDNLRQFASACSASAAPVGGPMPVRANSFPNQPLTCAEISEKISPKAALARPVQYIKIKTKEAKMENLEHTIAEIADYKQLTYGEAERWWDAVMGLMAKKVGQPKAALKAAMTDEINRMDAKTFNSFIDGMTEAMIEDDEAVFGK